MDYDKDHPVRDRHEIINDEIEELRKERDEILMEMAAEKRKERSTLLGRMVSAMAVP